MQIVLKSNRVQEKEFLKAGKANPRLKTKLKSFSKQMDGMDNSEDDWIAIRPEWTTVDRIIASRFEYLISLVLLSMFLKVIW